MGKTPCSSRVLCSTPFLEKKRGPEELSEKGQRLRAEHWRSMGEPQDRACSQRYHEVGAGCEAAL